jgi:hypothetical protein
MSVTGNLKANKLTLQGHGVANSNNVVLQVEDSTFSIAMGDEALMTLAPTGVEEINNSSTSTPSLLTINRNTRITGSLTVGDNTVLNGSISTECKTALSNLVVSSAWKPVYGCNIAPVFGGVSVVSALKLPYNDNIFTPVAAVHLYKNGDECQYQSGILKANPADSNLRVDDNTLYNGASLTKAVTSLLYARLKTLNVIPRGNGAKMVDFFPSMSNLTYWVPELSVTSNQHTLGQNTSEATCNVYP